MMGVISLMLFILRLLLVVATIGSYFTIKSSAIASKWVYHTERVISEISNTRVIISESQTSARAFIVTRDPYYLDRYKFFKNQIQPSLYHIKNLTRDNQVQQNNLKELTRIINEKIKFCDEYISLANQSNCEQVSEFISKNRERFLLANVRSLVEKMIDEENQLLIDRTTTNDYRTNFSLTAIPVTFFLILICVSIVTKSSF